jgi:hypothetical protein
MTLVVFVYIPCRLVEDMQRKDMAVMAMGSTCSRRIGVTMSTRVVKGGLNGGSLR